MRRHRTCPPIRGGHTRASGGLDTAPASNQAAIDTLGEALAGTGRPLAIVSGIASLTPGVRSMSGRFAPTVHGQGDNGLSAMIVVADRAPGQAEAIGGRYDLEPTAISPEQAAAHFGFLAQFVALDMPASSAITRQLLGWEPTGPTPIEDIQSGAYTNGPEG